MVKTTETDKTLNRVYKKLIYYKWGGVCVYMFHQSIEDIIVEVQLRLTGLVGSYARRPVSKNYILRSCKYLPMHTDQSVRTGVHWRTSYTTYTTSECA